MLSLTICDPACGSGHFLIAAALDLVPKGSWTAHDDLAELMGSTPDEVAHLLADGNVLATAYRVLTADGARWRPSATLTTVHEPVREQSAGSSTPRPSLAARSNARPG